MEPPHASRLAHKGEYVWGRMDTCICMAESLGCSPETITILLVRHTPMQNRMFKKKKDESVFVPLQNWKAEKESGDVFREYSVL